MSRIFQALKKAETVPPPAPAPSAEAQPSPAAPPPARAESRIAGGISSPRRSAPPAAVVRASIVAALPEQVTREMTTLRVSLESSMPESPSRSVVFMSSQGGEGTTTVAAQFVITLATDVRARVLFVDGNAQRPALVATPGATGPLFGLFSTGSPAGNGSLPTIDLLPVPEAVHLAGIYSPTELSAQLESLRSQYDWIVIDGPPVLYASEAAGLGAIADSAVVVVEAGRTKRPVLSRSVDLLRKAGARVLGSVLNRRQLEIPEFIYRRI
jgi:protein-tyrosine kinase